MKVYIVFVMMYGVDWEIEGVYASQESAEKEVARLKELNKGSRAFSCWTDEEEVK